MDPTKKQEGDILDQATRALRETPIPEELPTEKLDRFLATASTAQQGMAQGDDLTNTQDPAQPAVRLVPDVSTDSADGVRRGIHPIVQPPDRRHMRRRIVAMFQQKTARWSVTAAAAACILLVVGAASLFHWITRDRNIPPTSSAYYLFSKACAAEEAFFRQDRIVHLVNEIVVKAVSDPALARMRWLPVASLQAEGQFRFHQLTLPAEPGEEYVVEDQAWYDPATGRFARVLATGGKPIFANSYDGQSVYSLEAGAKGALQVSGKPVAKEFRRPTSPAEFLGIAAGLRSNLGAGDEGRIQDAGTATLADGSAVRVLKVSAEAGAPDGVADHYWLFRIRQDNNTIAEMEWLAAGESLLVVRRVKTEPAETPAVAWNLAGLSTPAANKGDRPKAGLVADMVVPNVSVQHMIDKASFETCIFATNPPWAGQRNITDILDIVSPPNRMFAITYRAKDGRHVVLVQSTTYNMLSKLTKLPGMRVVYQSPKGFKVWSGPALRPTWLAGILLQSARYDLKDPPSKQATGYLLETPAGTFPALAINGQVTEEELHTLIDSLIPAREYQGE